MNVKASVGFSRKARDVRSRAEDEAREHRGQAAEALRRSVRHGLPARATKGATYCKEPVRDCAKRTRWMRRSRSRVSSIPAETFDCEDGIRTVARDAALDAS